MLCWNGADALRLQLRSATAGGFLPDGHLGSCAVMLDGLPPQGRRSRLIWARRCRPGRRRAGMAPLPRARGARARELDRRRPRRRAAGGGGRRRRAARGAGRRADALRRERDAVRRQRPQGRLVVEVTFQHTALSAARTN